MQTLVGFQIPILLPQTPECCDYTVHRSQSSGLTLQAFTVHMLLWVSYHYTGVSKKRLVDEWGLAPEQMQQSPAQPSPEGARCNGLARHLAVG